MQNRHYLRNKVKDFSLVLEQLLVILLTSVRQFSALCITEGALSAVHSCNSPAKRSAEVVHLAVFSDCKKVGSRSCLPFCAWLKYP